MSITVKAYANCDDARVVWKTSERIDGCRGFALVRKDNTGKTSYVQTWVGFDSDPDAVPGTHKDSTVWPIQKFMWTDFLAEPGQSLCYQVIPMIGDAENLTPGEPSDWTEPVTVGPSAGPVSGYFNRGIVAAQWISRRLNAATPQAEKKALSQVIIDPADPVREYLAGPLRLEMLRLLDQVNASGGSIYATLYELSDPELMGKLEALGPRANLILANGTHGSGKGGAAAVDENEVARTELEGRVNLFNRMVTGNHLAHNKFVVFCDADGNPQSVWTGSTNWTPTGLCTQANNGILVNDPMVASFYRSEWDRLKQAGDDYPPSLKAAHDQGKSAAVSGTKVTVWFAAGDNEADLAYARGLINQAQQGIMFLFFNPGPKGTLLDDILARSGTDLYIHGVANQDPGGAQHPILLVNRGQQLPADEDVALPEAVDERLKFWQPELKGYSMVMVHSKVIVLDPFGQHPVVMTGSHNLGPKASTANDDNLIIVENDARLAAAYAVNIMEIYDQYRWRYFRVHSSTPDRWDGLVDQDTWQDFYLSGAPAHELDFWLGNLGGGTV